MTLALLCSGQGGQHPDMFAMTGNAPEAAGVFSHAAELLGSDPREWVRTATAPQLHANKNAQVLCTLQALAVATMLDAHWPVERCIAGYSVEELAAWSVAGLLEPARTLDLTMARAAAMDAARRGVQGMLFVRGLQRSIVDGLIAQRAAVAIVNPNDAYVLGGARAALDEIATDARRCGASRVALLDIEVASHTALMAGASVTFREALSRVPLVTSPGPSARLLSGIDGATVADVAQGREKLALQVSHTVQWAACLEACVEAGATAFLELGPGHALAGMAAAAYPSLPARGVDEFKSVQGVRAWLARLRDST